MELGQVQKILEEFSIKLESVHDTFLGYPENLSFDYKKLLSYNFLETCLNNLGDPYSDSTYKINSRTFEREVLEYFATKFKLQDYFGYITNCGTEGILYGIYIARELHPDGVVYYSKDSHYAVKKALKLLRMKSCEIDSLDNGEIDYRDLFEKIDTTHPVILNLNIGTVMKAAIDDIDRVLDVLKNKGVSDYYIHCDAALSGMFLEYIPDAPQIDFRKDIHSVSVSGHKFIGSPIPCGVVLTRNSFINKVNKEIEYLDIHDTTIMGSRSGFTPLVLWYAIKTRGDMGFKKEIEVCLENTNYLYQQLYKKQYPVWKNKFSNTVYFKRPSEDIINKWQLAKQNDIAHVVVMQHVTKEKIDSFVTDIINQ